MPCNLQENVASWSLGNASLSFASAVVFNTASQTFHAAVSIDKSRNHQVGLEMILHKFSIREHILLQDSSDGK